jgi:hypothetical protein
MGGLRSAKRPNARLSDPVRREVRNLREVSVLFNSGHWPYPLLKGKSGTDLTLFGNLAFESAKFRMCRFLLQKPGFAHSPPRGPTARFDLNVL